MKKEKEKIIINDEIIETEKIEVNPEDEIVSKKVINPADFDTRGKFFKGYAKTKVYTTSDTRITKPFIYGFCRIFFAIGFICLIFKDLFWGLLFVASALLFFLNSRKDIKRIEQDREFQGKQVKFNSKEEKKEFYNNYSEHIKEDFNDSVKTVFTKENFSKFFKASISLYILVSIIGVVLCLLVNIVLGIIAIIMFSLIGFLYYYFLSKICKH